MSSAVSPAAITSFDPSSVKAFRFISRRLESDGVVRLRYGLDELEFEETFVLPLAVADVTLGEKPLPSNGFSPRVTVDGLLDLLHWVAGVSYYKAAIPPTISFEANQPGPPTQALLKALYSEGLGEFAVVNGLAGLPQPQFQVATASVAAPPDAAGGSIKSEPLGEIRPAVAVTAPDAAGGSIKSEPLGEIRPAGAAGDGVRRLLVPVGGGKDSAVAIEIARQSGLDPTMFSVGNATPIAATATVSGYDRLMATRKLDPLLLQLNAAGALNGHVPITAIVSCVALLTAALNGHDAVALANERSASAGNLLWHGVEINHQFSKSLRAERLLSAAAAEIPAAPRVFSVLRPASELSIARAFARFDQYHPVFTSCNRIFHIDPDRRTTSWCCDCDKCRFVYLILAPFLDPQKLNKIFGRDLLADPLQYDGFALLTATGGEKPFECVGEVDECLAAIRLLSESPAWQDHAVVRRLTAEVLAERPVNDADIARHFALSDDHDVPDELIGAVRAVLGT